MHSRNVTVVIVVLIGCLVWPTTPRVVAAGEKASGPLTLPALIEEALRNNPEILSMRQRWEAAKEEVPQARSLEDPQLTITQWAIPSNFNLGKADETWYGIGQSFPFPGKRSLRGQVATKGAEAAEQDHQAKVREITAHVKTTYYQWYVIQKAVALHLEHQALLEEFIQIANQKYTVGQASQQDLLKAQVELSKLHNSLLVLEQEQVSAQAELNALLNRPPETPLGKPEELTVHPFSLTLEQLQQQALHERPELKAATFMIEKSERARSLANKNYLPDFMMEVTYWDVHTGAHQWMATAKMNLPWIFSAKYDARLRQAAAEEEQARADYAAMQNRTLFQLHDLFAKVKTTEQLIQVYQNGVLPQAEQSLEAARISYQHGKASFLDLIDSERTLRDLQLEYYTTLAQFEQHVAELEQAVGTTISF
jgi:cobalt-zinc-cadmium efflux system outer membrane protein